MVELSEWEWLDLNWFDRFDEWLDRSDCMEPDVEGSEHNEAPLSSFTPFTCSIIPHIHIISIPTHSMGVWVKFSISLTFVERCLWWELCCLRKYDGE